MVHTIRRPVFRVMFCAVFGAQISACSPGNAQSLSDDTYIRVMADLLVLSDSKGGSSTDSARAAVLARLGVSEAQVLKFAGAVGRDPERMEVLWTAIQAAVDSAQVASDSLASAPAETRFGSVVTGGADRDTVGSASAPDSVAAAAPALPRSTADSAKIRAIRERLRPRGVPRL
ncbi:MAG: hypothetical protein V3U67_07305 [Gemmatimonadota bacterium]